MDLTPKQQTSEAIRQAETIIVTTGQHPSVDQAAAVIGLAAILRKFGKKVTAIVSDSVPQSVQALEASSVDHNLSGMRDFILKVDVTKAEVDKLRYEVIDGKLNIFVTPFKGGFAPSDVTYGYGDFHYDLAIVLGVPTRARIDRIFEQNSHMFDTIPVVNLDFHRSNENYGAVNLIEPNASSLCEMLVALAESLQGGIIDAEIATALLMGIMGSTDRFTASHTTSKSLTVAAQMMAAGARQQAVVKALYRDGKSEQPRGGQAPRNAEKIDRPGGARPERGDRIPGSDRSGASERSADKPQVTPTRTDRDEARAPREERSHEPQNDAPERQQAPREEEKTVTLAPPVDDEVPQRGSDGYMPIIDPGHIELSDPEDSPPEPNVSEHASIPMADFAAAAEILAQRDNDADGPDGRHS